MWAMDVDKFQIADCLIFGGEEFSCEAPCLLWNEHKMETKAGDGGRRRSPKQLIDLFVWHWTGGEGDISRLFKTLDKRDLGVEFAIDTVGTIWQFCDPILVDTFDAGFVNPRSMGCEVVNYGFTMKNRKPTGELGKLRDTYFTRLRGRRREMARFFPAQLNSAYALAETVSLAVPTIPRCVPLDDDGELLMETMRRREIRNYSGHIGHFHISERKSDPGEDLLRMLIVNGYADEGRLGVDTWKVDASQFT